MSAANGTAVNVFDPESLVEVVKIAGKELRIRPLPLKVTRQLVSLVQEIVVSVTSGGQGTKMSDVFTAVLDRQHDVLPVLFPREQYEWLTKEFVEENMSIPALQHIADRVVRVNGLEGLLPFLLKREAPSSPAKVGG